MNLPVTMTESDRAGPKCDAGDCPIARATLRAAKAFNPAINKVSAGISWITLRANGDALYRSRTPAAAGDFMIAHDQGKRPSCVGFCLELFSVG